MQLHSLQPYRLNHLLVDIHEAKFTRDVESLKRYFQLKHSCDLGSIAIARFVYTYGISSFSPFILYRIGSSLDSKSIFPTLLSLMYCEHPVVKCILAKARGIILNAAREIKNTYGCLLDYESQTSGNITFPDNHLSLNWRIKDNAIELFAQYDWLSDGPPALLGKFPLEIVLALQHKKVVKDIMAILDIIPRVKDIYHEWAYSSWPGAFLWHSYNCRLLTYQITPSNLMPELTKTKLENFAETLSYKVPKTWTSTAEAWFGPGSLALIRYFRGLEEAFVFVICQPKGAMIEFCIFASANIDDWAVKVLDAWVSPRG